MKSPHAWQSFQVGLALLGFRLRPTDKKLMNVNGKSRNRENN